MADAFQLRLRLHTPVILPRVAPRLDILLTEAMHRYALDWTTPVTSLPLTYDEARGGYRGSQVIFGMTPEFNLIAQDVNFTSSVTRLPLHRSAGKRKKIKLDGGPTASKLGKHAGYLSPYLLFYGMGDAEQCAQLLGLLSNVGLEHARGQGYFSVESVVADSGEGWRQRPWLSAADHEGQPYTPIPDSLQMRVGGEEVAVHRPPRVLREMI